MYKKTAKTSKTSTKQFCVELVFLFCYNVLKISFSFIWCLLLLRSGQLYKVLLCTYICIDNGNNEPRALFMVIVKLVALTVLILSAGTFAEVAYGESDAISLYPLI